MSRIGKMPIEVPSGVEVRVEGALATVTTAGRTNVPLPSTNPARCTSTTVPGATPSRAGR